MLKTRLIKIALVALTIASTTVVAGGDSTITLSTDNDLFSPIQNDRDYTAGLAIAYSAEALEDSWNLIGTSLDILDTAFLPSADLSAKGPGALEFGVYGFTPEEISESSIIEDDRPYSSLMYLSSSQSRKIKGSHDSWSSSLTVGILGLDVFESGQNAIHQAIDSPRAEGWGHQVSDGGELTARYSLAYHSPIGEVISDHQFKTTLFGSVGYLTEFGAALVFRDGLISSPTERFNPELSMYGESSAGKEGGKSNESYFWGGVAIKARLYNAFLEGQFRDSEHTVSRSELNHVIAEGWIGYTQSLFNAYKFSYVLRVQSSEINQGAGDRTLAWGSLVLSRSF
tara:strand:+ start:2154 stop:3176 length:1023 start_codon:yes stop_codon:yes gene_type:complete